MGWLVGLQHGPDDYRLAAEETLKTYILAKCEPDEVVDYYHQRIKTRQGQLG